MRGAGCNGTVMGFEFWVPCASASVVETNFQRLINRSCACIWVSEFMRNYRRSSARRATSCSRQNMVYGKENHLPPSPPTPNAPSSCRTPVTTSVARSRHETLEDFPSNPDCPIHPHPALGAGSIRIFSPASPQQSQDNSTELRVYAIDCTYATAMVRGQSHILI